MCDAPLGMESGEINDSQVNASSRANKDPSDARLHNPSGHWKPKTNSIEEWLQIDFIKRVAVTQVATQGTSNENKEHWVTSYKLSSSKDAASWEYYKENGQEKVWPHMHESPGTPSPLPLSFSALRPQMMLTLLLPRVISFNFLLQLHQKILYHTV